MAAVFLLCLILGWKCNRAQTQREVVAAIQRAGGSVRYDYEFDGDEFLEDAKPCTPWWLRRLVGDEYFQEVVVAYFQGPEVERAGPRARAAGLEALKELDRLRGLFLVSNIR
jgi:hypothetical protein